MRKVVILCGVSGAGKSTRVKNEYQNSVVCSADYYFMVEGEYKFNPKKLSEAHGQCLRSFVESIHMGASLIVVDNTNTSVAEIAPYATLALAYGYELSIEIFKVDVDAAATRNLHGVPRETIIKMAQRIDSLEKKLPSWWPKKII
ncbi:MAG: AAA family ATPase [Patescibacteria group bacterium]|jgi:predicted kinase